MSLRNAPDSTDLKPTAEKAHPHAERSATAVPALLRSLLPALLAAIAAIGKVALIHTLLIGLALVAIAFWAGYSAGLARGIVAAASTLTVHIVAAPIVLLCSTFVAAAAAVQRLGIARAILATAVENAARLDPRVRDGNDYEQFTRILTAAFDSLSNDVEQIAPGRLAWMRRISTKLGRRIVRLVGKFTLAQLELAHREGKPPAYSTLDQWLGTRVDASVASSLRGSSRKWLVIVLVLQALLSLGCITGAITAPPLWGRTPAATPTPTYP